MEKYYAEVTPDGVVQQQITVVFEPSPPEEAGGGPGYEEPAPEPCSSENSVVPVSNLLDWTSQPSNTAVPIVDGDLVVWSETATLEQVKRIKIAEINASYLLANKTSFTFMGKEIQADEHAMKQINVTDAGIRRRGGLREDWRGFWKTLDNTYVPVPDVAAWNAMMDALEDQGNINFGKAQALKTAITNATTLEEIHSISWN